MEYINSQWKSKTDQRTIVIRKETSQWCGDRMFMAELLGSGKERLISLSTLKRKYDHVD